MNRFFATLTICLFLLSITFSQRIHVDETSFRYSYVVRIKKENKLVQGTIYSDFGDLGEFVDGRPVYRQKRWHKNGQLSSICYYDNNSLLGEYRSWHENGFLFKKGVYKYFPNYQGFKITYVYKKDGIWLTYFNNGKLRQKENYKNGLLHNRVEIYYENGNLLLESFFDNNKRTGCWKFYYENGTVAYEGNYLKDKKEGDWLIYDINGNLKIKEVFKDGKIIEPNYFYSNKQLLSDSNFKKGKDYRVIQFKKKLPYNYNDIIISSENPSIGNYWGNDCFFGNIDVKFKKDIKLIKIDYYDGGCWEPFTTITLKDSLSNILFEYKNISFLIETVIISDPELLKRCKYLTIKHCEGVTEKITIIYN